MKVMKKILVGTGTAALLLALTGCVSLVNTPQGKIMSVTERGVGMVIAQSPANQTPEVKFGFFSSTVVLVPTSTNGPTQAPNYANTFGFAQTGALQLGIDEQIASGNEQTSQPGGTNSANVITPVVPK